MSENLHSSNPDDLEKLESQKDRYINPEPLGHLREQNDRFIEGETILNEYLTVEALARNYQVQVSSDEKGILTIGLEKDDISYSVNAFLPNGYQIQSVEGETGTHYKQFKRVDIPPDILSKRGGLLVLFHEIGHAIHDDLEGKDISPIETDIAEVQARVKGMIADWDAKRQGLKHLRSNQEFLSRVFLPKNVYNSLLPDWFKDKFYEQEARKERQAWFYALTLMRFLESEGFNVFSDFKDHKDLKRFIDVQLRSYEYNYEFDKKFYYKNGENYNPIFVRKNTKEF